MSSAPTAFRLARLPLAPRVALTMFIALMGIGYLASMAHLFNTYSEMDGKPGVSAEDVRLHLYGQRNNTVLESKINGGSMSQYLPVASERNAVLAWIHRGATAETYKSVQPILAKRCVGCHNSKGSASFRPLTSYAEVAAVTEVDTGESPAAWARVAHIHLLSISFMLLALGLAFAFCGFSEWFKAIVVGLPFVCLVTDFGSRALASRIPDMVYGVMGSGALMGLLVAVMCAGTFWEMWFVRLKDTPRAEPSPAVRVPEPAFAPGAE